VEKLPLTRSETLFAEALELSPGGVMGIRRPYNFVPGEYPVFIERGAGGHIFDVDGNEYIDMLCSYGPLILGHVEPEIDEAVVAQMRRGFCFSLAQPWQNRLLGRLRELIPCAEMGVLVKTGSDATTCAVRVARAATDRPKILRCGYHGWHDWCVEVRGGIPPKVYEDVHEFHFNDLAGLERLLDQHRGEVAAIILTPVGHPLNAPVEAPGPGYLQGVRELASRHGAVLIFDEIRTGFRVGLGGAQARYGVTPDLAVFGKAMANGYPIAAVVGRRDLMKVLEGKAFISSTYFPNSLEMVAALKCIEILERDRVLESLWERGQRFLDRLHAIVRASGVPCTASGIPPMPFITFDRDDAGRYRERRTRFYTEAIRRRLFIQPFHHWYLCHRHTDADLSRALEIIEESLAIVRREVE
jgi:glutamate-1-semialdehyde aminotransferase